MFKTIRRHLFILCRIISYGVSLAARGYLKSSVSTPQTKPSGKNLHFTERGINLLGRYIRILQHDFLQLPQKHNFLLGGVIRGMIVGLVHFNILDGPVAGYHRPGMTAQSLVLQTSEVTTRNGKGSKRDSDFWVIKFSSLTSLADFLS